MRSFENSEVWQPDHQRSICLNEAACADVQAKADLRRGLGAVKYVLAGNVCRLAERHPLIGNSAAEPRVVGRIVSDTMIGLLHLHTDGLRMTRSREEPLTAR